jgi:hypothetical protein
MGCTKSKDANESKTVEFKAKKTNVPDADAFFEKFEPLVKQVEDIRVKIQDSREKSVNAAGTGKVKDESARFQTAVQVFLWSVSAGHEGKIQSARPQTFDKDPYFSIDTKNCVEQVKDLNTHVTEFISTAPTAPEKFQEIFTEISNILGQAEETITKVKEATKDLPFKEKTEAISNAASNSSALKALKTKLTELAPHVKSAGEDVKKILSSMKDWITKADEVGDKAFKAKHFAPVTIFNLYHPEGAKDAKAPAADAKKEEAPKADAHKPDPHAAGGDHSHPHSH